MSNQISIGLIAAVLLGLGISMWFHQQNPALKTEDSNDVASLLQIKAAAFSSVASSPEERQKIEEAAKLYASTRTSGLSRVQGDTRVFNLLSFSSNSLSVLAIMASFLVSVCGAKVGVNLSASASKRELESVGKSNRKVRTWILILSATSALLIGLGNRLNSFGADYRQKVNNLVNRIEKADANVKEALNASEIEDAAHKLETDFLRL